MYKKLVDEFNQQSIKWSAILKNVYFNPQDIFFQYIPNREEDKRKEEVNRLRNGFLVDTLTSVVNWKVVKIGGKVVEACEVVIYRENF